MAKKTTFYSITLPVTTSDALRDITGRKRLTDSQAKAIMARAEDILAEDEDFLDTIQEAISLAVVDWDQTN